MKKSLISLGFALLALSPLTVTATPTAQDISNSCGLSTQCGYLIANLNFTLQNNTYVVAVNAAGGGTINLLKADATDDTVLNADTGDVIKLAIAGTTEVTVDNDQISFSGATAEIVPGATSLSFKNNADNATNLGIADAGAITVRSTIISSGTSSIGWSVVAGANTACNTTCTAACVFGVNTAATEADIVDCADATADECLCAGAS